MAEHMNLLSNDKKKTVKNNGLNTKLGSYSYNSSECKFLLKRNSQRKKLNSSSQKLTVKIIFFFVCLHVFANYLLTLLEVVKESLGYNFYLLFLFLI